MSLRHAILGVLSAAPTTGYELVRYFHERVGYVWSAPQSQIYPELHRMERDGLVASNVMPRGARGEKRVYSITDAGLAELLRWAGAPLPYPPVRDPHRLKTLFFDMATFDEVRTRLQDHIAHYAAFLEQWQQRVDNIRGGRSALVARRLADRPPAEHAAIVEFKAFAFEGQVAVAEAEIAWARRGLALVDRLEAERRAALEGTSAGDPPAPPDNVPLSSPA